METTHIRSAVALLLAVGITGGIVLLLESATPGLTDGTALRTGLAWPEAAESQYQSLGGLWLAIRVLLGAYISVVAAIVGIQVLVTLRETLSTGRGLEP